MNYTKGKWENDSFLNPVSGGHHSFGCSESGREDYDFRVEWHNDMPTKEAQANALLIAAAPELLAALTYIVNCQPESGEAAIFDSVGYNMACNAIEKAIENQ